MFVKTRNGCRTIAEDSAIAARHSNECCYKVVIRQVDFEYSELYYNRKRRHSARKYRTPAEWERNNKILNSVSVFSGPVHAV